MHDRILVAALLLTLSACGSTEYLIATNDGELIPTYGKPELDNTTGRYSYKDTNGVVRRIPADDVSRVIKR